MRKRILGIVAIAASFAAGVPAAHHSTEVAFDLQKLKTLPQANNSNTVKARNVRSHRHHVHPRRNLFLKRVFSCAERATGREPVKV
jgi:hypothetical protein